MSDILTSIVTGEQDSNLDAIIDAARDRQKLLGGVVKYTLRKGDEVRIKGIRPRYLNDLIAKVDKVNKTTVSLKFEGENKEAAGRYGYGVRMPFEFVEKV